jgi:hypothetical protein
MVMRADRLWTGGNVLKAAFHRRAHTCPVRSLRGGSHQSKSTRGLLIREVSRHGQVRQRSLHRIRWSYHKRHNIRATRWCDAGIEQPSQHWAAALKVKSGDDVNDCVSLIWDSALNRKEHF